MFGIGTTEFLVIIVVAILVLGPEHLPRIMRTVTKVMSDFRRVSTEFQRTINLEASQEEWEKQQAEAKKKKRKKRAEPAPDVSEKDSGPEATAPAEPEPPADELAAEMGGATATPPASPSAEPVTRTGTIASDDKTAAASNREDGKPGAGS